MEVEDLRLFTEVVVHGGISEAARHNHMPQQTLSRHIISLERELGGSLFERSTPIVLTPIGKVVLRRAYEIVSSAEGMKAEISRVASVTNGTVRVRRYETDSFSIFCHAWSRRFSSRAPTSSWNSSPKTTRTPTWFDRELSTSASFAR